MVDKKSRLKPNRLKADNPDSEFRYRAFPQLDPFVQHDWYPRVDVSQMNNHILVQAELPDIDKDAIEVSIIEGRYLNIRGEKRQENEGNKQEFYRVERNFGYFDRTIGLPAEVDEASVEAVYRRGVLKISMRKLPDTAKRIPIQTA